VVFHLAQSNRYREFPEGSEDVRAINVDATMELAEWASRAGVRRMIFASTGNVYGHTPRPADETEPTRAHTMYAASKLAAEVLLRPFSSLLVVLITRLFGIYGPGQRGTLFPQMMERVRRGEEITLAGGIGVKLNPLFVDDCVSILAALSKVAQPGAYEVVNVGGTQTVTLAEVVEIIESLLGRRACVRTTNDEPTNLVGDVTKLGRLVSIQAFVPLRQGLARTIDALGRESD
jgi:nucleoside-diphosphate-sugar epimerase